MTYLEGTELLYNGARVVAVGRAVNQHAQYVRYISGGRRFFVPNSMLRPITDSDPRPVPEPEEQRQMQIGDVVIYDGNSPCPVVRRNFRAGDRLIIYDVGERTHLCGKEGTIHYLHVEVGCLSLAPDEGRPFSEGDIVVLTSVWSRIDHRYVGPGAISNYVRPGETRLRLSRRYSRNSVPHWWVEGCDPSPERFTGEWVIPEDFLRHVDSPGSAASPPPARIKVYGAGSVPGYCGGIDISTTECLPRYVDRVEDAVELENGDLFNISVDLLDRRTILTRSQQQLDAVLYALEYHGLGCSVFQQGSRFPAVVIPDNIRRDLSGDLDQLEYTDECYAGSYRSLENSTISSMRLFSGASMPVSLFDYEKVGEMCILLNSSWCREAGVTGYKSGQALGNWLKAVLKKADSTNGSEPIRLFREPWPIYLHILATMTNPSENDMPAIALAFSNTGTFFTETGH